MRKHRVDFIETFQTYTVTQTGFDIFQHFTTYRSQEMDGDLHILWFGNDLM